jgi:outer membrane protein OmpA-like peptidoglycan-associated protein
VTLTLVGCATAPRQDAALNEARSAVTAAHADPQVVGDARAELATADTALRSADALLAGGKPIVDVEHQAYLADRYAQAAQQHGQLLASAAAIADLDNRRNAVLLRAREADARRATARAESMAADAHDARLEAAVSANDAVVANNRAAASANDTIAANDRAATSANDTIAANDRAAASANDTIAANDRAAASANDTIAANDRADLLDAQLTDLQGRRTDRGVVVTLGDVLFATNKSELQVGSQRSIDKLTAFLSSHPKRTIRVEGFTDNVGSDEYNRALADRRAGAVADALMRGGIDRDRIQMEGYGNAYPVAANDTIVGRQQNRRVEVVISNNDQRIADRTE